MELDRGPGLNELGHSFLQNKRRTRSGDFVKVQYKIEYKVNEMRGRGLKMQQEA